MGDTNTFAVLGEVAYGLAGEDTNDIAGEAAVGGEENVRGEEERTYGEDSVPEGDFAVSVAVVVNKGPVVVEAGEGEMGDTDSSVDKEAIGLEGGLVAAVDLADPIGKHTGENAHWLKVVVAAVVVVEWRQLLTAEELFLLVPAFATSTIQLHSHEPGWQDLKSTWL